MDLRSYNYRLYPSRKQKKRLLDTFNTCKSVYNELLELNIDAYKITGKGINTFGFNKHLKAKHPKLHSQVKQNVSDRVSKAFNNFYRRCKDSSCKKKGFPRFKSSVHSITYPQSGFKFLSNKRLQCSKIGNIPIVLHRLPKGKIKTLTIKRNRAGQWFACLSCDVEIGRAKHPSRNHVGIDVGLENFATLSDGTVIENPRFLLKSERRLKRLQRRLSRKIKGSRNRRKARFLVVRQHLKINNQRSDFLHKVSHRIANEYSVIKIENLNINGMVKNHRLAKHIHDASWGCFGNMLTYKAVTCGGECIAVDPRGTSRTCSNCGCVIDMPLSERTFRCHDCGNVCHRDLNASRNIESREGHSQTYTPVDDCVRLSLKAVICEAGTTFGKSQIH